MPASAAVPRWGGADPELAAQLGLAAHRLAPGPDSLGSVLSSTNGPYADRLTGYRDDVFAVAFSGDGGTMATGSADATVRLWHLGAAAAASRICARVRTSIGADEWQRRFPGLPPEPPCR